MHDPTRARLLDAAQRLIWAHPGRDPSVRRIAEMAGTNLALISYHFGGKDGLLSDLFAAHVGAVLQKRAAGLDQLTKNQRLSLQSVLDVWIRPLLDAREDHVFFRHLTTMLRLYHADLYQKLFARFFDSANLPFIDALAALAPGLTRATVIWRLYAIAGACLTLSDVAVRESMRDISEQTCRVDEGQESMRQVLSFAVGAFATPEPD